MDHCGDYEILKSCVENGYTSLMIDASKLSYKENVELTKRVVDLGHQNGACVESELGKIGGVEDDVKVDERDAAFTVPEEALDFVIKTGIDTLAIAIGTAHGIYKGKPELDYDRLQKIRALVNVPLVLHGASGVPYDDVRKAISLGISKVNIATELKIPFADAIKEVFSKNPSENDPRNYMGAGRDAAQNMVEYKIRMCRSENKI
jgi:ketose-bisphosphate aldolase